ncbi:MAG: CsgG/HfaB family protein [Candidatus Hodarchaeota archaeon]
MKKLYIILIAFLILANCAPKPKYYIKTVPTPPRYFSKIAVIPENWDTYWISSFSYRALITELMDVGFNVIERSNLEAILGEQKLQQSGLIETKEDQSVNFQTYTLDKNKIAEIGRLLGVNNLILVYVVPTGRKIHLGTVRLVDVETGKVLTSTTFVAPFNGEDTDVVMKQISLDIVLALRSKSRVIHNNLFDSKDGYSKISERKKGDKLLEKD